MASEQREASPPKPTVDQLGIDVTALKWQRSGAGDGSFEVAFVGVGAAGEDGAGEQGAGPHGEEDRAGALWVLLRVAGDPAGRVLVYDRTEWACFIDGVRGGEFDLGEPAGRGRTATRSGSNLCSKKPY